MQDDKPLTEQESLALIASMINQAKDDYHDTGISCLLWGSVITLCSVVTFIANKINVGWLGYIWYLSVAAVVGQVIISIQENRRKKFTSHTDAPMGGIWISFGVTMFMFSFYASKFGPSHSNALFLIAYGIPTFATGFMRRFTPMLIGGIACWVLAIAAMYTDFPYTMLYSAVAAQLAWFIPGLILRKRYLKAKRANV